MTSLEHKTFHYAIISQIRQPPILARSFPLGEPAAGQIKNENRCEPHGVNDGKIVSIAGRNLAEECAVEKPMERLAAHGGDDDGEQMDSVQMQHVEEHRHAAEHP